MFAVIRHYHFDPKNSAEIDRQVREDFVPLIKKAKGFVRYYWLDTGKGEGVSLSVFEDKAGADESVRLAADYVQKHLSKLLTEKPEVIEGRVRAHD
jgi:quinol monooxygenase YgiN